MLTLHMLLPNALILKTRVQFENLVFVIMSTRENTRLIARASFDLLSMFRGLIIQTIKMKHSQV